MGILYLILSALSESVWNLFLARSKGLVDWRVNALGILFAISAAILFKKALNMVSLSVGVAMWSGFSILFTIVFDMYLFKTKIDFTIGFFMVLCIGSIIGLNYFSKTH